MMEDKEDRFSLKMHFQFDTYLSKISKLTFFYQKVEYLLTFP